jgi:hypothetical protein
MMKKGLRISTSVAIVLLLFLLTTCRQDISVPNPGAEKLFGTWTWLNSYCAWSRYSSPATTGYTQTISFDRDGICKLYQNGELKEKCKFSLSIGRSIRGVDTAVLINYSDKKNNTGYLLIPQSFIIEDNTLYLMDEAIDACSYTYAR